MKMQRLLYLGFAFPPGVAGLFPEAQPAGHLVETGLVNSLRTRFEIRSVGISWIDVEKVPAGDPSPGLPHALNLLDRTPVLLHRYHSLFRLRRQYRAWTTAGWTPEAILMCNFSPVYNGFIRWLKRQPHAPRSVLYLADSMNLQKRYSVSRRLRHRFKPLTWPDFEMVRYVDACAAVSLSTKEFFMQRRLPWLWLPNGCDPGRALRGESDVPEGPRRFGYIGTLAAHGGVPALLRIFTSRELDAELHVCGFGKAKTIISQQCAGHPRLRFHEPRTPDGCVQLARGWDVLVNPRPICQGNENNFSSKVFEYALSGRSILTSRVSGADKILGDQAFYFDEYDYDRSLGNALDQLIQVPRAELNRRGANLQERLVTHYSWAQQGQRLAEFIADVLHDRADPLRAVSQTAAPT
jgi:glycosyltransferase involved in cell wall biosynthesis